MSNCSEESEMPLSLLQVEALVRDEYDKLTKFVGFTPTCQIDVYHPAAVPGTARPSAIDAATAAAWYTRGWIGIPVEQGDLQVLHDAQPRLFPPTCWDKFACPTEVWEQWRFELWHEACHEYQDTVVGAWDPNDGDEGHAIGWPNAVSDFAKKFGVSADVLEAVLR